MGQSKECRDRAQRWWEQSFAPLAMAAIGIALAVSDASIAHASTMPDRVHVRQATIAYGELAFRLRGVEVVLPDFSPIALSVDRIDGPFGSLPFWASAKIRSDGKAWRMSGVVASGGGEVVLRFDADASTGWRFSTAPIRFGPEGIQPAELWSPLAMVGHAEGGSVTLEFRWPTGPAAISVEGLRFVSDYGAVGPIDGRVELARLWPPRTVKPQELRIAALELAALVDAFGVTDLEAEGRIDADLRFSVLDDGKLLIEKSALVARGTGVLRYRADEPPAILAAQGESVDLLFRALSDFHYEALAATVSGYLDGDLTVALQLRGANPDLYEGHPIELNVNLEAPILALALAGRDLMELPQMVRDVLSRYEQ